jgi:hypothetical protein
LNPPEDHPWKTHSSRQGDLFAHPNSIYAKAKKDPLVLERILDGMREADEDLASMEEWARNGFVAR